MISLISWPRTQHATIKAAVATARRMGASNAALPLADLCHVVAWAPESPVGRAVAALEREGFRAAVVECPRTHTTWVGRSNGEAVIDPIQP